MPQAVQNLSKDAPFARVDLVSCRNLLIYLGAELQHQPALLFHYTLNPGGCLVRGASETIGGFTELFSIQYPKGKLSRRRESAAAPWSPGPGGYYRERISQKRRPRSRLLLALDERPISRELGSTTWLRAEVSRRRHLLSV